MTEPLPPFSGDKSVCRKCSYTEAFTEHKAEGAARSAAIEFFDVALLERLERRCGRCDFVWDEALNPPKAQQ